MSVAVVLSSWVAGTVDVNSAYIKVLSSCRQFLPSLHLHHAAARLLYTCFSPLYSYSVAFAVDSPGFRTAKAAESQITHSTTTTAAAVMSNLPSEPEFEQVCIRVALLVVFD